MDTQEIKDLQFSRSLASYSSRLGKWAKSVRIKNLNAQIKREVSRGLWSDCRSFRNSWDGGGTPNRRQRKHAQSGGTHYRNGMHWTWAENTT